MKRKFLWMLAATLISLTGCARGEAPPDGQEGQTRTDAQTPESDQSAGQNALSGGKVPVAQFQEVKADIGSLFNYSWLGDSIMYSQSQWLAEEDSRKKTLYQAAIDGTGEPQIVLEETPHELYFDVFFTDREDCLYLFGREMDGGATKYYMKKTDAAGQELYCEYVGQTLPNMSGESSMAYGYADSHGNSVLINMDGFGYLFDSEGKYLGSQKIELSQYSFLDGGEDGVFLWENNSGSKGVTLVQIDWQTASFREPVQLTFTGILDQFSSYTLLSGYELGILLSTNSTLFQYDPDTGKGTELLNWQAGTVNVDGASVSQLRFLPKNEDGTQDIELLSYSFAENAAETALIQYMDESELPEKEVITLGTAFSPTVEKLLRRFNRSNLKYAVELLEYDNRTMEESLMYGKDNIPDLIDTGWITPEVLAGKGLLEDLEPYFEKSSVISREDILEPIWEAGIAGGRLTSALINFDIQTLITSAESVPDDGWSYEDMFALDRANPKLQLLDYFSPSTVYNLLMRTGMDHFIDFDEKKCSFDSDEYIQLLEDINSLNYPEQPKEGHSGQVIYEDEEIARFLSGEFMIRYDTYSSPYHYQTAMDKYGGKARSVGYPTPDGSACFLINNRIKLSIYSGSEHKDAAWAFIEYLLSEEQQSWYGTSFQGFPARKDAFESYLNKPYSQSLVFKDENPTEEYREYLRYMVQHMRGMQTIYTKELSNIMYEETESYFQGGKTAKEAASVIQNRIQLFLDEMN